MIDGRTCVLGTIFSITNYVLHFPSQNFINIRNTIQAVAYFYITNISLVIRWPIDNENGKIIHLETQLYSLKNLAYFSR